MNSVYPKSFPPIVVALPNGSVISIETQLSPVDELQDMYEIIVGHLNTHGNMDIIEYYPKKKNQNGKIMEERITFRNRTCYEPQ